MNSTPFFLPLALVSWFFTMAFSVLFPAMPQAAPVALCGAGALLAALWRMKERNRKPGIGYGWRHWSHSLAAHCLLCAAALLPSFVFLLAAASMGPVSSIMVFGLLSVLVALPLDARLGRATSNAAAAR